MESWMNDVRLSIRQLARNPGFTAAAVITLALGIGANSSIFTLANAMRMVPDRFERPEELVFLWTSDTRFDTGSNNALDWFDWRERAESFVEMAAFASTDRVLTGQGEPQTIGVIRASATLLPMLGLEPRLGRFPIPSDDAAGAVPVAVLTDHFWQRTFAGRADVLGRTIELDEVAHTIIGVLPPGLQFNRLWRGAQVFAPLSLDPATLTREGFGYWSIARLRPGVSAEQAQAELDGIVAGLAQAYPGTNAARTGHVEPMDEFFFSFDDRVAMGATLIAVTAVLMIACVNLANLMLARATSRGGEFAVRSALGAGRLRIVRQLLTESLLLAGLGGGLGLLTSLWVVRLFNSSYELSFFRASEIGPNPVALTYTFLIAVGSALVFGLAPGLSASRVPIADVLRGSGASAGRPRTRLRNAIIVGQLGLTLPLLITCAMAARQLVFLESLDFGFDGENLLTLRVDLPRHRYEDPRRREAFFREVEQALQGAPDIRAVGASMSFPVGVGDFRAYEGEIVVEGGTGGEERRPDDARGYTVVTPGYFHAMGVPLVSGRLFTWRDRSGQPTAAIVNRNMADHYWAGDNAIGKRFTFDVSASPVEWITVVGIIENFGADFWGEPIGPRMYLPLAHRPQSSMIVVARTIADPAAAIGGVRAAIHGIDAGVPLYDFRTVADHIDAWLNESRVIATMLGSMGFLALGLASIGLFGMISFSVAHRTREIGVRVALGAGKPAIMALVFRRSLRLAVVGVAIGLLLSLATGLILVSTVYGVEAPRASTVLGSVLLLLAIVLVAAYLPARRATRIDPLQALRSE